ncbi:MAG: dephospho-CoA kinase [Spirochaetales bacterium]|nr:dephospho-CoA kinase [Spirochaetales bacterium]
MVIGLTGKSCSGKNYVGDMLTQEGFLVWDADRMCHDGLIENKDAIISLFGEKAGTEKDGVFVPDRREIGRMVFADPAKRTALEGVLYPWLEKKVLQWKKANPDGVLFLNGALLYRAGFSRIGDCVIYVDADYEVRLGRAMKRDGVSREVFDLREKAQEDVDYRKVSYGLPLYIVANNEFNLENLRRQVFNICDRIGILKGNRD